ncbi:NPCBM/NEW2 domain-containing protein [Kribbella kalugense]|uniref:NPCBM/NEW2 domain-containing protein n=1 Tax=Kribbella kalugense TaxID=2512221 RepID=UPI00192E24C5|nr:NPCBM/NEW2 domain-containing protein [Kribbella kalugense]
MTAPNVSRGVSGTSSGPSLPSSAIERWPPACTRFTAVAGVDDEVDPDGTVRFTVTADGATLATTPVLTNSSDPYPIDVDVTGAQHLTRHR